LAIKPLRKKINAVVFMSNDAHGTIRLGKYDFPSMLHIFLMEPFTTYMK
jgi:hypothetical protein